MINRKKFFDGIRQGPFPGKLSASQVSGMEAILTEWEARGLTDLRHLSYMLGTAFWETARTMQPIREKGSDTYLTRMYDIRGARPALARRNGNINPGDGILFCGKGYVQLTWRGNYRRLGDFLHQPLEDNPNLAMRPDIASKIMFEGMARGSFTGKSLKNYFNASVTDWVNARRIINGTDHAADIAGISKQFYSDLVVAA